jgi:hypothetical protein
MRAVQGPLEAAVMGVLVGTLMREQADQQFLRLTDVHVEQVNGVYANEVTVRGASGTVVRITVEEEGHEAADPDHPLSL